MKTLNSIKCENAGCGYEGEFFVEKIGWYWPVVIFGLIFWPLLLLLLLNTNKAYCPECDVMSHDKPLVKEPKTGGSLFYRVVVWGFLTFIAFIFYLALRG